MIVERSLRTMIRWTPVCGPGPRLYWVSDVPSGCRIVKETTVAVPARTACAGSKFWSWYVRGAPTVTDGPAEEPQPATTTMAGRRRARTRRITTFLSRESGVQEKEGDDRRR